MIIKMNKYIKSLLLITIGSTLLSATELSGDIGGKVLQSGDGPFIVTDNLVVPIEKKTVIQKGCVFLFKPFTGITVEGELLINGYGDAPVVLTSFNDQNYNKLSKVQPENFDWNGITIQKEAKNVKFSHFKLYYSVFGIKSYKNAFTIRNGIFANNGQFHLTIKDTMQRVTENSPFNYGSEWDIAENAGARPNLSLTDAIVKLRKPAPYIAIGTGLAALACGGYYFYKKDYYHSKYQKTRDQSIMDHYISREVSVRNVAGVFTFAGGILCVGGGGLLFYDLKSKHSTAMSFNAPPLSSAGIDFYLNF